MELNEVPEELNVTQEEWDAMLVNLRKFYGKYGEDGD